MTKICEDISENLENVKDEQTNYEFELAEDYADLLTEEKELEEKIITLNQEIKVLEEKAANGTITEEENTELIAKKGELTSLVSNSNRNKMDDLLGQADKKKNELQDKLDIAEDIGEVTLEHGEKLANTEVKKPNWFRRLFSNTKKQEHKKAVGEKAIEVSTNLLDQVDSFKPKDIKTGEHITVTNSKITTTEEPVVEEEKNKEENEKEIKEPQQ